MIFRFLVDDDGFCLFEGRAAQSDTGVRSRLSRGSLLAKRTPPKTKQKRVSPSGRTPAQRSTFRMLPTRDSAETEENEPRERSDSDRDTGTTDMIPPIIAYPEDMGADVAVLEDDVRW